MNANQREAAKAGVNLSADAGGGYTKHSNVKRTDKKCPRCRGRVCRDQRKCLDCGGRLLWGFDDAEPFNRTFTHYFRWHKFINGFTGWVDADYWKGGFDQLKF